MTRHLPVNSKKIGDNLHICFFCDRNSMIIACLIWSLSTRIMYTSSDIDVAFSVGGNINFLSRENICVVSVHLSAFEAVGQVIFLACERVKMRR